MPTYLYWSGGDNSSGTEAGGWAAAKNTFAGALALATASGDVIKVHKGSQETITANTTWTVSNNITIVVVNKDASDALSEMGDDGFIGNSTTSYIMTFRGAYRCRVHGLTFRNAGNSTSTNVSINDTDGGHFEFDRCYFSLQSTNTNPGYGNITIGQLGTTRLNCYTKFSKCVFRFGHASKTISANQDCIFDRCSYHASSSAMSGLFNSSASGQVVCTDCDWSNMASGATLVASQTIEGSFFNFNRCKLPTNYLALATQTVTSLAGGKVLLTDCSVGDTHGTLHYADSFGSLVSDSSIYFTSGVAAQSWKIVTTANCSHVTPFVTPEIPVYHTGTSEITPYFEILRDGSTTAYQTDEIGAEFSVKVTSGSVVGTTYSDYMPLLGTPADQAAGAGTGSWTGDTEAWSGKIDSGSSLTPAENGEILGRALVGEPSITVYLDPQIRW